MKGEGGGGGGDASGGAAVGEEAGVRAEFGLQASAGGRWRGCGSGPAPWRPSGRWVCV